MLAMRALIPLLMMFASTAGIAQQACSARTRALTEMGHTISLGMPLNPSQDLKAVVLADSASEKLRYARLLVSVSGPKGAVWRLTFRDHELRPLAVLAGDSAEPHMWTGRLRLNDGNQIYAELAAPQGVRAHLVEATVMLEGAKSAYYSLQKDGDPQYVPLYGADSRHRRLGDHVGFLMSHLGKKNWCCSAVAIDEDHVLTNWHCGGDEAELGVSGVWQSEICRRTIIDFSWDGDQHDREFVCENVVFSSRTLDVAILRVTPLNARRDRLIPAVVRRGPIEAEVLKVVHHPACQPKQISLNCPVSEASRKGWTGLPGTEFSYPCDTENGSSGSPVFDQSGQIVGLHHFGFERRGAVCDGLNKAVKVEAIIRTLAEECKTSSSAPAHCAQLKWRVSQK